MYRPNHKAINACIADKDAYRRRSPRKRETLIDRHRSFGRRQEVDSAQDWNPYAAPEPECLPEIHMDPRLALRVMKRCARLGLAGILDSLNNADPGSYPAHITKLQDAIMKDPRSEEALEAVLVLLELQGFRCNGALEELGIGKAQRESYYQERKLDFFQATKAFSIPVSFLTMTMSPFMIDDLVSQSNNHMIHPALVALLIPFTLFAGFTVLSLSFIKESAMAGQGPAKELLDRLHKG